MLRQTHYSSTSKVFSSSVGCRTPDTRSFSCTSPVGAYQSGQSKYRRPISHSGLALDHHGNLYVSSNESDVPIVVYSHPIDRPHFLRTFCARRPETRIAIDEEDDLYLSEGHFTRGDHPAVAVLDGRADSCPAKALRHISAERQRFTYVGAIALFEERLYVSVVLANGGYPIFTFDAQRGRQVPLNVLTLSGVDDFGEFLAVGP